MDLLYLIRSSTASAILNKERQMVTSAMTKRKVSFSHISTPLASIHSKVQKINTRTIFASLFTTLKEMLPQLNTTMIQQRPIAAS